MFLKLKSAISGILTENIRQSMKKSSTQRPESPRFLLPATIARLKFFQKLFLEILRKNKYIILI